MEEHSNYIQLNIFGGGGGENEIEKRKVKGSNILNTWYIMMMNNFDN